MVWLRNVAWALAAALAFYILADSARHWSGDLTPSPFWLATASTTALALAVPRRRIAVIAGGLVGDVAAGLWLFDDNLRGVITPVAGNTLETIIIVVGAVRLLGPTPRIQRTRQAILILLLVVLACVASGLVATSDTSSTVIGDRLESLWRWTLGDIVGEVHLVPLVLYAGSPILVGRHRAAALELASSAAILGVAGIVTFAFDSPVSYLLVPGVLWIAIRFGPAVSTLVALISALAATWASGRGFGPFVNFGDDPVVDVQLFNIAVGLSALVGGAHALRAWTDQQQLHQSEQRWRTLGDSAFEGIGRVNSAGVIVDANDRLGQIIGVPPSAIVGRRVVEVLSHTDWQRLHHHRARFARGERSVFETWIDHPDGMRRWVEVRSRPLQDGGGGVFLAADITEARVERTARVAAEHRLAMVEQDQRTQLAEELHDGPIQSLSAALLRLSTYRKQRPADADLISAHNIVETSLEQLRQSLQSLSSERVHADDLEDFLRAAADRFSGKNGPILDLRLESAGELLDHRAQLVFEIAREAVSNAIVHAEPTKIEVELLQTSTQLTLEIRDDGSGFDEAARDVPGHLGLRLMRIRAAELGSALDIIQREPNGTLIRVEIERRRGQQHQTAHET